MTQENKKDGRVRSGDRNAPGRRSRYNHCLLLAQLDKNPRRAGTHGHRSYQIILDAGADGILYEDFRKAGGRNRDFAWDMLRDRIEIKENQS